MDFKKIIEMSFALAGRHRYSQRCKHFSFIFEKNKLISIGINSPKTHPLNLKYNYVNKQKDKISHIVGTHSEMNAVIKLGLLTNCEGLTIVNTRINRKKEIDYSLPCNGCMDMLLDLKFEKIYYTTKEKKFNFISLIHEYSH
jgi:deoxycytidylate deaminase